jgi:hypothetical protein
MEQPARSATAGTAVARSLYRNTLPNGLTRGRAPSQSSRGGIRTRDLRVMRSPEPPHPMPAPIQQLSSGALRSAQITSAMPFRAPRSPRATWRGRRTGSGPPVDTSRSGAHRRTAGAVSCRCHEQSMRPVRHARIRRSASHRHRWRCTVCDHPRSACQHPPGPPSQASSRAVPSVGF